MAIWERKWSPWIVAYNSTSTEVHERVQKAKAYYGATEDDIVIDSLQEEVFHNERNTRYRFDLKTYKGWKVYMYMTGCFASNPKYED